MAPPSESSSFPSIDDRRIFSSIEFPCSKICESATFFVETRYERVDFLDKFRLKVQRDRPLVASSSVQYVCGDGSFRSRLDAIRRKGECARVGLNANVSDRLSAVNRVPATGGRSV